MPRTALRSAAGRELLLVAQLAPPSTLSAARRAAGLVKYLERLGHRVTVLTSMSSGGGGLAGAAHVVRTRDLLVSPVNWRRESFASLAGGGDAAYDAAPSRLASLLVPDLAVVGWLPFALPRALTLAASRSFDAVLTTSPPHSAHLIGLALHARGLPWVADFRDGWTFESDRPAWPSRSQDTLDRRLERAVAERAERLVAVTDPIAADLAARFGREVATVTNGFDPDEHSGPAAAAELGRAAPVPNRHSLLHAGRMAYAGRSPAALLAALRRAPELRRRIEVLFAGPLSGGERELIDHPDLAGAARAVGSLDRERTLGLEGRCDSLLVLTSGHRRGEATQKVFEYLATGKPILVLGEDTEAARIVTDAQGGIVAPADDPDAIGAALRRLVDGEVVGASEPAVARYSYARLAQAMAEQVERAITARRRRS
ncbi:MAG: glycosyltransferase [Actinomycetota bacterium]|nr:glycosyltransferase [Actinomycetota bacterium]